jgi:hypothetical protein
MSYCLGFTTGTEMSPSPAWEKAKSDLKILVSKGLVLLLLLIVCGYLVNFGISYKGWVAFTNNVAVRNVLMEPELHDCKWDSAPLGAKHCHYNRQISKVDGTVSDSKIKIVVEWERVND